MAKNTLKITKGSLVLLNMMLGADKWATKVQDSFRAGQIMLRIEDVVESMPDASEDEHIHRAWIKESYCLALTKKERDTCSLAIKTSIEAGNIRPNGIALNPLISAFELVEIDDDDKDEEDTSNEK